MLEEIWDIILKTSENPESRNLFISHMKLYEKTLEYLKGDSKILEVGCGKGHGTFLISKNMPTSKVIGIDINKRRIRFAKKTWRLENLEFEVLDILNIKDIKKIERKYGKFDFIICFEVLEHIPPEKTEDFLMNIKSLLKSDGILFLSTPNKDIYDINAYTHGHINEMNYNEIMNLFEKVDLDCVSSFGRFIWNKYTSNVLLKWNLIHRKNDKFINLSLFRIVIRKSIVAILSPKRAWIEIIKIINKKKYIKIKYKFENLKDKDVEYSTGLFFILKKK